MLLRFFGTATRAAAAILALGIGGAAHANGPVMDYSSLLSGTTIGQADKSFIPGLLSPGYRGAFIDGEVTATLTRAGESEPLRVYTYRSNVVKGAINALDLNGGGDFLNLETIGTGDYRLTFSSGGTPMTVLDFTLLNEKMGDAFNPLTVWGFDGPFDDWALLRIPFGSGERDDSEPRDALQLVNWMQNDGSDRIAAEIRLDGDTIAVGSFYLQDRPLDWQRTTFKMALPENKGGAPFRIDDLLSRDGTYDVFFTLGDALESAFQLTVRNGKEVYHPRQAPDHAPRTEYLLPRQYEAPGGGVPRGFDVVYMEALTAEEARRRYESGPAATAGPDDATLARWQWQPSSDPGRPTTLTLTDIAVEADSTLRVGDEIVAFGVDYPSGIAWMKVGDTEPRRVPEGETFDSRVFGVCGRKLVLTRDRAVFVFDTDSGALSAIPPDVIHLKDVRGGLHGNNYMACDGHLVATINDTGKVTDRLTVKLIDVSGAEPTVIPIKNGPYTDNRLDNIAVDAAQGIVAMGSSNEDALYLAPVVPMANQIAVDLSKYKSIRASQPFIVEGGVVYADDEYKLRFLPFGSTEPRRLSDAAFGGSSNGFFADHGRLAMATSESFGDRYEFAVGGLEGKPAVLAGTGTKIEGTSGALGMAGVAAIVPDGTVFLAGTPRGGIGTGEHLQVLDRAAGQWVAVTDAEGTAFGAIDVSAGKRLVAFKHGDRGTTRLGYIAFGESVDVAGLTGAAAEAAADARAAEEAEAAAAAAGQAATEQARQAIEASQQDMAFVAAYVESHKGIADTFVTAFGEEEGLKKARDMTVDVMIGNGHEHLVPLFDKLIQ